MELDDRDISESAAREAAEETGIVLASHALCLISVDVHAIPPKKAEPLHLHHDLTFAFRAANAVVTVTEETAGVVWADSSEFDKYGLAANLRRAVLRALAIHH